MGEKAKANSRGRVKWKVSNNTNFDLHREQKGGGGVKMHQN